MTTAPFGEQGFNEHIDDLGNQVTDIASRTRLGYGMDYPETVIESTVVQMANLDNSQGPALTEEEFTQAIRHSYDVQQVAKKGINEVRYERPQRASAKLADALREFPLASGHVEFTDPDGSGNVVTYTRFRYADASRIDKEHADILVVSPSGKRLFSFNISRTIGTDDVDMDVQTTGRIIYSPQNNLTANWTVMGRDNGMLEELEEAAGKMEQYAPVVRSAGEELANQVQTITKDSLATLDRANEKPRRPDVKGSIGKDAYAIRADYSSHSKSSEPVAFHIAQGNTGFHLGHDKPNLHATLNADKTELQISAETGRTDEKLSLATDITVTFYKDQNGEVVVSTMRCTDPSATIHAEALASIGEITAFGKEIYPPTWRKRLQVFGGRVLQLATKL
jgi:hypothetical protein